MHKLMGLFAVVLLAVTAPLAHATIELTYTIDGVAGPASPCGPSGTPGFVICGGGGEVGNADVSIGGLIGFSNSPGGILGIENSSNTVIQNLTNAPHHIVINVVANGYMSPSGLNIKYLSHIGGTVAIGSADNSLTFLSCIDTTNSLTGCPGSASVTGSPSITAIGSYNNDKTGVVPGSLPAPFAIAEQIDIMIGGGANINFSASTTLSQVPEPMSITLLGGMILLVSRSIRRKHNRVS